MTSERKKSGTRLVPWMSVILLLILPLWLSVGVFPKLHQAVASSLQGQAEGSLLLEFFLNNATHNSHHSSKHHKHLHNNPLIPYDYHRVDWDKAVARGCTNFTVAPCRRKDGQCPLRNVACEETCFTDAAWDNPLYPFTSIQDHITYTNVTLSQKLKTRQRHCKQQMLQFPQPNNVSWCSWTKQANPWENAPKRCSKAYGNAGLSGPFDRMMVFPQHKLAFCGIPKVGITNWIKFLRFVLGANDFLSHPHFKKDKKYFFFDNFQWEHQEQILNDPSWTKAVFLRQPAERVLSAYKDRIEGKTGKTKVGTQYVDLNFEQFLAKLENEAPIDSKHCPSTMKGESWCMDPHWRPQYYSCAMYEHLPNMDFVGSLEQGISSNHTRALLERVGLWESHGQHYDANPPSVGKTCKIYPNYSNTDFTPRGFQQAAPQTRHATGSRAQMEEYYTKEAQERVARLYKHDIALWNALLQEMDEHDGKWATGTALAKRLNPEQCG